MSDLFNLVIKELGSYVDQWVLYKDNSAHLSVCDFEYSARC